MSTPKSETKNVVDVVVELGPKEETTTAEQLKEESTSPDDTSAIKESEPEKELLQPTGDPNTNRFPCRYCPLDGPPCRGFSFLDGRALGKESTPYIQVLVHEPYLSPRDFFTRSWKTIMADTTCNQKIRKLHASIASVFRVFEFADYFPKALYGYSFDLGYNLIPIRHPDSEEEAKEQDALINSVLFTKDGSPSGSFYVDLSRLRFHPNNEERHWFKGMIVLTDKMFDFLHKPIRKEHSETLFSELFMGHGTLLAISEPPPDHKEPTGPSDPEYPTNHEELTDSDEPKDRTNHDGPSDSSDPTEPSDILPSDLYFNSRESHMHSHNAILLSWLSKNRSPQTRRLSKSGMIDIKGILTFLADPLLKSIRSPAPTDGSGGSEYNRAIFEDEVHTIDPLPDSSYSSERYKLLIHLFEELFTVAMHWAIERDDLNYSFRMIEQDESLTEEQRKRFFAAQLCDYVTNERIEFESHLGRIGFFCSMICFIMQGRAPSVDERLCRYLFEESQPGFSVA